MSFYSRRNKNPYAIVIGLDGMNGLQTARILTSWKIPVIGIAKDPTHWGCRTKVCEDIFFNDTESDLLIDTLVDLGPKFNQKPVLFPCKDLNVITISKFRTKLEQWYHVILPSHDVIEKLMYKTNFYLYALKEGFPIPRTHFLHNKEDAEKASSELIYPCVLKPTIRSLEWELHSKFKAYKAFSQKEFLALYAQYAKWSDMLIVQEWVEGPDSNLFSCNCYFDANSEPIVTFVARKLRQWPPETGESCLGEECQNDTVLGETIRLFSSVNYRGLGYLEMKQDERTGKHFIIEPNVGRPTGRSAIAECGGVDLLYTMYCDAIDRPLPPTRTQKYIGVKWIFLRRDFQSAFYYWRNGELTIKEWWESLQGKKTYALFSWNDPGPFLSDLWRSIRLLFRRGVSGGIQIHKQGKKIKA